MAHNLDLNAFQLTITEVIQELESKNQAVEDRCRLLESQTEELRRENLDFKTSSQQQMLCIGELSNQIVMANSKIESIIDAVLLFCTDECEEFNANSSNDLEHIVLDDENHTPQEQQDNDKDEVVEIAVKDLVGTNDIAEQKTHEEVLLQNEDELDDIQANHQEDADLKAEIQVLLIENEEVKAAEKRNQEELERQRKLDEEQAKAEEETRKQRILEEKEKARRQKEEEMERQRQQLEAEKAEKERKRVELEARLAEERERLAEESRRRRIAEENERKSKREAAIQKKGLIRAFCRVRPPLVKQSTNNLNSRDLVAEVHEEVSDSLALIDLKGDDRRTKEYFMDHVFSPSSSQEQVFCEVQDLIESAMDGNQVCIMAYGQTGSGKTFTMEGTDTNPGLIPRAAKHISSSRAQDGWAFRVKVSATEIYNNKI
jgi:hypothetical protein